MKSGYYKDGSKVILGVEGMDTMNIIQKRAMKEGRVNAEG